MTIKSFDINVLMCKRKLTFSEINLKLKRRMKKHMSGRKMKNVKSENTRKLQL